MGDRTITKPEIASQKRVIKLPPAIGDWTTYRPPKVIVKKVKSGLYGFDRLSKKELNQALQIHYNFIQELFKQLKVDLNIGIEFSQVQIEQTTYLNFLRTLSGSVAQGKLALPEVHEGIQLFIELDIASSLINHALGSHDLELINRGLTEAEAAVLKTTWETYLPLYVKAFENTFPTPTFDLVGSPDVTLDPAISTSTTFVCFTAEAAINDNPFGRITFGYLSSTLKKLLSRYQDKVKAKPLNFGKLPAAALSSIVIPVAALLGTTSLTTSDLDQLEIGDVVSLDSSTKSPLLLKVGGGLKLLTQPGISNRKKAVRIAGFDEDEQIEVAPPLAVTEATPPPAPAVPVSLPVEAITEQPETEPSEDVFQQELALEEDFSEDEQDMDEELFEEEELLDNPKEV